MRSICSDWLQPADSSSSEPPDPFAAPHVRSVD
jgi:hypothetical protein